MAEHVRQAVVIIHGMGEQRSLDALNGFVRAALEPDERPGPPYISRPDKITDSYESRRYLAPATADRAQTEFYEYHWADRMVGNELGDLVPVLRRLLIRPIWRVPSGLRFAWLVIWSLVVALVWALIWGPWSDIPLTDGWARTALTTLISSGALVAVLTYLLTKFIPSRLTTSFVDVVRYLDTSPRSYAVRRDIRRGIVDLLQGLHDSGRYQRIVIVAHSLGSYIAYDAISYLWPRMNKLHAGNPEERAGRESAAADDAEETPGAGEGLGRDLAAALDGEGGLEDLARRMRSDNGPDDLVSEYRAKQREVWHALRMQGNPWLITDFISIGSPMYFADLLYTKTPKEFRRRRDLFELPVCPPVSDIGAQGDTPTYSWENAGRRVLFHGAPFAVVRWTNLWFPNRWGLFGDWFGGPLAPLFGSGVHDVPVTASKFLRWVPAIAHARYFKYPDEVDAPRRVTRALRLALDLNSDLWLEPTMDAPKFDEETR